MKTPRGVLVAAIAMPLAALGISLAVFQHRKASLEATPTPKPIDVRQKAIETIDAASHLPAEARLAAIGAAEKLNGGPFVESILARARLHRAAGRAAAEHDEVARAEKLEPAHPDVQIARLGLESIAWAARSLPVPRLIASSTSFARPVTNPPSKAPPIDATGWTARPAALAALLLRATSDQDPGPALGPASREGMDDRLQGALGVQALRAGHHDAAIAWLRGAVAADPKRPEPRRALALALLLRGDWPAALEACREWIALAPTDADAPAWEAVAHQALGDRAKARASLEASAKLGPAHRLAAAWGAFHAGDHAAARAAAEALVPAEPDARLLRGVLRLEAPDAAGALADAEAMLADRKDDYDALCLKADALVAMNRDEEALAAWAAAEALAPGRPQARLARADVLRRLKRYGEALADLAELPELSDALWRRTLLLLDKGDVDEAYQAARTGLDRYPGDPLQRIGMARVLHVRGDHYGELTALKQALSLDPNHAEAKRLAEECRKELEPR